MFINNLHSLLFVVIMLGTNDALAHAIVTGTSLSLHPLTADRNSIVSLQFNSDLELSLSKVYLVRDGDIFEELREAKGNKPGEVFVVIPPLSAGSYAIRYKVFAADGHITENTIRFKVIMGH